MCVSLIVCVHMTDVFVSIFVCAYCVYYIIELTFSYFCFQQINWRQKAYSEASHELGFTHYIGDKKIQKPQCVVYNAIVCQESKKVLSKLGDRVIIKYPNIPSKPVGYFQRLEGMLKRQ